MRGNLATEPQSVRELLGCWKWRDKDKYAAVLMRSLDNVRLNDEGIVVCKKCGGARMFHLTDYGKDCWLPIICQ